jgi:hypothetical protein
MLHGEDQQLPVAGFRSRAIRISSASRARDIAGGRSHVVSHSRTFRGRCDIGQFSPRYRSRVLVHQAAADHRRPKQQQVEFRHLILEECCRTNRFRAERRGNATRSFGRKIIDTA